MLIPFWKMHGAGNDFILVDDRALQFPVRNVRWISGLAERRTGIGAEGLILIQPSTRADFRMRFFNPDGGEADMCGNGARCVARLAHEIGVAPARMTMETSAGLVGAEARGEQVLLFMPDPRDWRMGRSLDLGGRHVAYHFVNSGVPHTVVEVADLAGADVPGRGAAIRRHADFAPAGTNVNFMAVTGPASLSVRTYERGVEAETLACGTGIVACGLVAGRLGKVKPPVSITCAGGDVLEVNYRLEGDSAAEVTLLGPAAHVFRGAMEAPS